MMRRWLHGIMIVAALAAVAALVIGSGDRTALHAQEPPGIQPTGTPSPTPAPPGKVIVQRFYDLFNRRDLDGIDALVAPDVVDHNPFPGQPSGRVVRFDAIEIFRVVNGRIVEAWHIEDLAGILVQIGALLAPDQAPAGPRSLPNTGDGTCTEDTGDCE